MLLQDFSQGSIKFKFPRRDMTGTFHANHFDGLADRFPLGQLLFQKR